MLQTIQEAATTLFNAAEIPFSLQPAWHAYTDLLVASPKKSVQYYFTEEHAAIPWWSILRSLRTVPSYSERLWEALWQRSLNRLDRRRPVCLAVDDYVVRRYGRKAYLADYFYSNAHGGVVWGNALVDTVVRNGTLQCPVTFELHQRGAPRTLWERGLAQVTQTAHRLQAAGVRANRIWVVGDCTYGNAAMAAELRSLGGFYLLGVPKNRIVESFGRVKRMDAYFAPLPERRLTVAGKAYRYKISTANLKDWGRRRLLAVWGPGPRWRYFACNKLIVTPKTLLQRARDRWTVEDHHRDVKQFHGGEHFYVWSRQAVLGHFQLAYVSCAVAALERTQRRQQGVPCTMEQLHREAIRWSRAS